MTSLWTFLLVWGVWLITPMVIDGTESLVRLVTVLADRRRRDKRRRRRVADEDLPSMSIIVPCHNEVEVIDRCLNSIKAQDFPHDRLEVIIVDDGSTDGTAEKVERHLDGPTLPDDFILRGRPVKVGHFHGSINLIRADHGGKADALNAGLSIAAGDIVVNIDSDVVLDPGAARAMAEYFHDNPGVDAATGNVEIDWDVIEDRDEHGRLVLDDHGNLVPRTLGWFEWFLVKCQFLEYLTAFDLGRRSQSISGMMYSLAGACSAFRRSVFDTGLSYRNDTVSEDTLLTFDLHTRGHRIGYMSEARVHLEPVVDVDGLYAQRLRWARGQLEVVGVHEEQLSDGSLGRFGRLGVPQKLLFDHTLAFPRLVWMPLIACFPLIGYSWRLLAIAATAMYVFYVCVEAINSLSAYVISSEEIRRRIEKTEWAIVGLPLYRFFVFHFRFAGFLTALTEEQQWTRRGPLQTARDDARFLRLRSLEFVTTMVLSIAPVVLRSARTIAAAMLPLATVLAIQLEAILQNRRSS